jgi:hypothetical protein
MQTMQIRQAEKGQEMSEEEPPIRGEFDITFLLMRMVSAAVDAIAEKAPPSRRPEMAAWLYKELAMNCQERARMAQEAAKEGASANQ